MVTFAARGIEQGLGPLRAGARVVLEDLPGRGDFRAFDPAQDVPQ
ncbi:hypothetical protein [Streptomyces sp. NBC_01803]|nr:hypothetical protein [Streptomyces sp. NBC_01803]WSA46445.1 hypothetical protein OIE51_21020 [Streptomyces sp. NBC_01803]